jgi:hypothetical protein
MRLLLMIIIVAGIALFIARQQKEKVQNEETPEAPPAAFQESRGPVQPAATPSSGDWMWDKSRANSPLDKRPKPNH